MKSISNEIEKRSARLIDMVVPLSAINTSYVSITGYLILMPKVSLLLKSSLTPID